MSVWHVAVDSSGWFHAADRAKYVYDNGTARDDVSFVEDAANYRDACDKAKRLNEVAEVMGS